MAQLFVGLMAEGSTDYRFLNPIIEKTLTQIAFDEIDQEIEILVFDINFKKEGGFPDHVYNASKDGFTKYGIMSLVVHADADALNSRDIYKNKISPAFKLIKEQASEELCKELVAIIPVYETESWLLANKELLKKLIGTNKSDVQLGINGHPESMRRPKEKLIGAIRIGRQDLPSKIRDSMNISDLYSILGEAIDIDDLLRYDSYKDFLGNIKAMLKNLNLLS